MARSIFWASTSQYGDSGNAMRHKDTIILGMVKILAVFLQVSKYPITQVNRNPADMNMLGIMVKLFLILGCTVSAM